MCLKTKHNLTETITLRQETLASQLATVRDAIRQVESEIVEAIELNHDVLAILHSFTMEEAPSNATRSLATQLEKSESDFKESATYLLEAKNSCEEWTGINQLATQTTWKINQSNGKQYRVMNQLATYTQSSPDPSVILLNYVLHRLKVANLWGEVTEDESSSDDDGKI